MWIETQQKHLNLVPNLKNAKDLAGIHVLKVKRNLFSFVKWESRSLIPTKPGFHSHPFIVYLTTIRWFVWFMFFIYRSHGSYGIGKNNEFMVFLLYVFFQHPKSSLRILQMNSRPSKKNIHATVWQTWPEVFSSHPPGFTEKPFPFPPPCGFDCGEFDCFFRRLLVAKSRNQFSFLPFRPRRRMGICSWNFSGKKTTATKIPIPTTYGIFTYIWLICMVNVGKYTSPMDGMGYSSAPKTYPKHIQLNLEDFCK